jgi:hypothetical protein
MALLTAKQQRDLLIAAGLIDFVTRGKLTAGAFDALKAVVTRAGPPVARGTRTLGAAVAPAALPLYGGYLGAEMARRQYELGGLEQALSNVPIGYPINPTAAEQLGVLGTPLSPTVDLYTPVVKAKKRVSTYARNVGKAMKAIKASAKGGKKGKLSNPKKTFSTVARTVSKVMKGGTRPKAGMGRIISKAVKGVYKKRRGKSKRRTSSKGSYTLTVQQ